VLESIGGGRKTEPKSVNFLTRRFAGGPFFSRLARDDLRGLVDRAVPEKKASVHRVGTSAEAQVGVRSGDDGGQRIVGR
jgi:hypothetical protein